MPSGVYHRTRGAKLTREQVESMLADIAAGMAKTAVAEKYGVSRVCVWQIENGKVWADVDRDAGDMTEAELDAMIAEQLPTMPREPRYSDGPRLPQVVIRGRGVQSRPRRIEA